LKLFVFDLDKTVLNSKNKLSIVNSQVLDIISERQIILIPATGRNMFGIPKEILEKNIRYFIVSNGAKIIDNKRKKVIWHKYLLQKELISIVQVLKSKKVLFLYSIHSGNVCFDSSIIQVIIRSLFYHNHSKLLKKESIINLEYVYKIQIMVLSKRKMSIMYNKLKEVKGVHVVKSSSRYIEITAEHANKGTALKYISKYLSIPNNNIVAIGDNENDLEMLKFAGVSYAVENATDIVRKNVDYIISNNDNNPLKDIKLD